MKRIIITCIFLASIYMLASCSSSMSGAGGTGGASNSAYNESTQQQFPGVSDISAASEKQSDFDDDDDSERRDAAIASDQGPSQEESHAEVESVESPELSDDLSAAVQPIIDSSGMDICVTVVDLQTLQRASIGGDKSMYAASMIKLLIAAAFMDQVDMGAISLNDTYVIQSGDIVGGTGVLAGAGAGTAIAYNDLLLRMIDVSDNTAANILIQAAGGMEAVNSKAASLGLSQTQLNRFMMDESAIAQGIENYTSTNDAAKLLEMIYGNQLGQQESSEIILTALRTQQDNEGLARGLPAGTVFAHKTGTLGTVRHDGGIVEGSHPYIIVAMCGGQGFYEAGANAAMANIASTVDSYFTAG